MVEIIARLYTGLLQRFLQIIFIIVSSPTVCSTCYLAIMQENDDLHFSRTWLPKLRKMSSSSSEDEYGSLLESVCKSGRVPDVLDMAVDWIKASLTGRLSPFPHSVIYIIYDCQSYLKSLMWY